MATDLERPSLIALGRYPWVLAALFAIVWVVLAIAPHYRSDWALENALVVPFLIVLVVTWRRFRFSNLAYTSLFVFLVLHEIGAHLHLRRGPVRRLVEVVDRSLAGRAVRMAA